MSTKKESSLSVEELKTKSADDYVSEVTELYNEARKHALACVKDDGWDADYVMRQAMVNILSGETNPCVRRWHNIIRVSTQPLPEKLF